MRTYLSHGIEDMPFAIISHGGAKTRDHELLLGLFAAKEAGLTVSDDDFEAISIRPHLVADVIRNRLLDGKALDRLLSVSPAVLFRAMSLDMEALAPAIWPRIEHDLETIERLLAMRSERDIQLPESIDTLLERLQIDPNRYYRVISERRKAHELRALTDVAMREETAANAFFLFRLNRDAPLPDPDSVYRDEEYAYLTAKLMIGRGAAPSDVSFYTSGLSEPRWIFHALRDRLVSELDQSTLMERLAGSPAWMVEWMQRSHMGLLERSHWEAWLKRPMPANSLRSDVELWAKSTRVSRTLSEALA